MHAELLLYSSHQGSKTQFRRASYFYDSSPIPTLIVEDGQVISRFSSPGDLGWHAKVLKFPIANGLLIPPITKNPCKFSDMPRAGWRVGGWGGVAR